MGVIPGGFLPTPPPVITQTCWRGLCSTVPSGQLARAPARRFSTQAMAMAPRCIPQAEH